MRPVHDDQRDRRYVLPIKEGPQPLRNSEVKSSLYPWFPLDRNVFVKSCDPSKFLLAVQRFARIYDKICKSEPISVTFILSIVTDLFTLTQNLLESHDFTTPYDLMETRP